MATARKGGKVQSKIQMLLYGEQGTGKSTISSQLLYLKRPDGKPFRVLFLDGESGSIDDMLESIENDGINLDNLYIVYTQSLKEVNDYIKRATNKEPFYELDDDGKEDFDKMVLDADGEQFIPDAIVVDGTTVLNLSVKQGLVEFSKKRANVKAERDKLLGEEKFVKVEGAGLELKDYNTINFKGQDLVLTLTGSGLHYIITARETDEKISIKDEDGKITSIATGKKIPEGFKEMGYNVKTELRLFRDENDPELVKAYVVKDRTKTYKNGDTIEDPSLFAFQAVIDKTKDHDEVVVQNRLHDAIKKELKETEKEVLGEDTDISTTNEDVEDLIKQVLDRMTQLGSTPKSKQETKIKLQEAGLPTAPSGFKNTKDIVMLKKALEILA
jgi:GTPase SAR1 family protein